MSRDREWLFDRVNIFLSYDRSAFSTSAAPRSRRSRAEQIMFGYTQQLRKQKQAASPDRRRVDHVDRAGRDRARRRRTPTRLTPLELDLFFIVLDDRRQRDNTQRDLGRASWPSSSTPTNSTCCAAIPTVMSNDGGGDPALDPLAGPHTSAARRRSTPRSHGVPIAAPATASRSGTRRRTATRTQFDDPFSLRHKDHA